MGPPFNDDRPRKLVGTTTDVHVLIYILQSLVETHGPCTHPRVLRVKPPWDFSLKYPWKNSLKIHKFFKQKQWVYKKMGWKLKQTSSLAIV